MKKILLSILTIGLASSVAVGVTRAYFSNQGTSTGNTFSAGTLDLKLTDSDEAVQDDVSASWVGANMAPGGTAVSGWVDLTNTGTIIGNHAEVIAVNTCDEAGMDSYLEITSASYGGGSVLGSIIDNNLNGIKDLSDLVQADGSLTGLDNLALADINITHRLALSVKLHENTPDTYQGKSCTTVFTFTLNQHSSQ